MTDARRARARRPAAATTPHVVILTGLSGARQDGGREAVRGPRLHRRRQPARRAPAPTLADLVVATASASRASRSCSTSAPATPPLAFGAMRGALEGRGIRPQVFFLEARDEVLIRRFSETRHRHPLADERGIAGSIAEERRLLEPSAPRPTSSSTRSDLSLRELRERIFAPARDRRRRRTSLAIQLISFGFKYGVPARGRPRLRRPVHGEPVLRRPSCARCRA